MVDRREELHDVKSQRTSLETLNPPRLPVISGLFIALVMKLFYIKAAPLNMTLLSFVDDGTILAQSKQLDDNNVGLHKAYKIIYLLFVAFTLVLEHDKTELFHFSCQRDT
ncbi:unnamed protein product [Cyclocybe aegerita]|uniref:Reverse transcriptase domain-containing protein n=1 Tax=Cyclocybe aegerita TaxID=1973307 RepID=A0A8S0X2M3_CYCAE|nr:unnamed protein product [Cyclocybe aegerita]